MRFSPEAELDDRIRLEFRERTSHSSRASATKMHPAQPGRWRKTRSFAPRWFIAYFRISLGAFASPPPPPPLPLLLLILPFILLHASTLDFSLALTAATPSVLKHVAHEQTVGAILG